MISDFVLGLDAVHVFWIHCDTDRSMCRTYSADQAGVGVK